MIAVSQYKNSFQFIEWIPSEKGPLVIECGKINIKPVPGIGKYHQLLQKLKPQSDTDIPMYSLSLDNESVYLTETPVDSQFDDTQILDWFKLQSLGTESGNSLESYHYPFSSDQKKYLNIHIPSTLKEEMTNAAKGLSSELRELGVGIFSAEAGARYWFNASQYKSYGIWRIGNPHQFLVVQDDSLSAFFTFKTKENEVTTISQFGSFDLMDAVLKNIKTIYTKRKIQFSNIDQLFYYQISGNYPELKLLSESKDSKLTALNPFEKLEMSNGKKLSPLQGMAFAETGNSFRGVDV